MDIQYCLGFKDSSIPILSKHNSFLHWSSACRNAVCVMSTYFGTCLSQPLFLGMVFTNGCTLSARTKLYIYSSIACGAYWCTCNNCVCSVKWGIAFRFTGMMTLTADFEQVGDLFYNASFHIKDLLIHYLKPDDNAMFLSSTGCFTKQQCSLNSGLDVCSAAVNGTMNVELLSLCYTTRLHLLQNTVVPWYPWLL